MKVFSLSLITILALTVAIPVISSPLLPRSQVCANDGITIAGTVFERRSLSDRRSLSEVSSPPVQPRDNPVPIPCVWCAVGSATYVMINSFNGNEPGNAMSSVVVTMLSDALAYINTEISVRGDGLVPNGVFDYSSLGFQWYSVNSNNHQQTWGVVGEAIEALLTFMVKYSSYGMAHFNIYDGPNQVAAGTLGPNFYD